MKWVFVSAYAVAIILSIAAAVSTPDEGTTDAVCTLVWATDDNPARGEQMELFRQWHMEKYGEKIDIRIDPVNHEVTKIVVQSLAGAGPDVFDFWMLESFDRFVQSGILLDLTDVADKRGFGKDLVWPGIWSTMIHEGRQYAVPDNVGNNVLIYHKDLFDSAGLEYPRDSMHWNEFLQIAKKLTRENEKGLKQFGLMAMDPMLLMLQNGAHIFNANGTRCALNSPRALQALQFYHDLRVEHGVMPTPAEMASQASAGGWGGGWVNIFASKRFAMAVGGRYWFIAFDRDSRDRMKQGHDPDLNLGIAELPHFTEPYDIAGGRVTGINRISRNTEYTMRFLEFLTSKRFNRQINRSYDAIAPVIEHCRDSSGSWDISDGAPPPPGLEAADDTLWVRAMHYAHAHETSPFLPPHMVSRFWEEARGLLDALEMTPAEALSLFERLANDQIERAVAKDPKLRKRYQACMAAQQS